DRKIFIEAPLPSSLDDRYIRQARACGLERREQEPVVELMIAGGEDAPGDARSEAWLQLAAVVAAQPFHRKPELPLLLVHVPQQLRIVAIDAHDQRALGAQIDARAGFGLQGGDEFGIPPQAFVAEADQRLLL